MSKVHIEFESQLTTFYKNPTINAQANQLFDTLREKIFEKIDELKNTVFKECISNNDEIFDLFKAFFYKSVFEETIQMALRDMKEKYSLPKNIISLLTEEKLKDAISGKQMLYAFTTAIKTEHKNS